MALAETLQLLEDYTNESSGQLPWVDEDDDLAWEAKTRYSGYLNAVESYQKSHVNKKGESTLKPGERIVAKIDWASSNRTDWPRAVDWFKRQAETETDKEAREVSPRGRPPTPEELAQMSL